MKITPYDVAPEARTGVAGMRSMTGYGRGEVTRNECTVVAEISSVNRRQLDVRLNLPRCLALRETSFHELVKQHISRGHVTGSVTLMSSAADAGVPGLTMESARSAIEALRQTAKALGLADDLRASHLLRLSALRRDASDAPPPPEAESTALAALDAALCALCAMREAEGERLRTDLEGRLNSLRARLEAIEIRAPAVIKDAREQVQRRLADAGQEATLEDESFRRELLLVATRSDITEEITRLHSHFEQATDFMQSNTPIGRALDFLVQEIGREINTLGAKASDTLISQEVVVFKTELDRFREQVQNIE